MQDYSLYRRQKLVLNRKTSSNREMINLLEKYQKVDFDVAGLDTQYKIEREGEKLFIYFQGSMSAVDWVHNMFFLKYPYKGMGDVKWKCHAGFLQCWKNVEDIVGDRIRDQRIKQIIIVGHSHGAALAVFCHEYCWFHRPDLRGSIRGFGFGCPRVVGHYKLPQGITERWEGFTIIRNGNDIVTHVPPACFKFCHVSAPISIGSPLSFLPTKCHLTGAYLESLRKLV